MSTVVIFGNVERPFHRMARAVVESANWLPGPIVVQAGANCSYFESLQDGFVVFKTCSFVRLTELIQTASLVIMHGGVGAVKESTLAGLCPAVFVRKANLGEHIDDHQTDWCEMIFKKGLATRVDDAGDLIEYVGKKSFSQKNPQAVWDFFDDSALRIAIQSSIRRALR